MKYSNNFIRVGRFYESWIVVFESPPLPKYTFNGIRIRDHSFRTTHFPVYSRLSNCLNISRTLIPP